MKVVRIAIVAALFFSLCGSARARNGGGNVERRMQKLEAQLKALQKELATLKAERTDAQQRRVNAMVSRAIEENKDQLDLLPDWVTTMKLKGDFRYRHEYADDESSTDHSNRHRIRARLGAYGKVNDEVDFGIRIASGSSNPTSTNQDLEDAFSSKSIWLDLAYVDYHPDAVDGLHVLAGKVKNPYFKCGTSDLMFDNDVTPEGIAATYKTTLTDDLNAFGTFGGYYVGENQSETADSDAHLWALQVGLKYQIPDLEKTYVTAGGGYYDYGNVKDRGTLRSSTNSYGNKTTNDDYNSDFDIVQAFCEIGFPVLGYPVRIFGDYLENVNAESSEDHGFLIGATVGKCKKPGSWQFGYNYRQLDADAVIGALTEGTFAGGGSDVKGHTLSFGYQIAKNWQFGASYMMAERMRSENTTDHDVVLIDFKYKF